MGFLTKWFGKKKALERGAVRCLVIEQLEKRSIENGSNGCVLIEGLISLDVYSTFDQPAMQQVPSVCVVDHQGEMHFFALFDLIPELRPGS